MEIKKLSVEQLVEYVNNEFKKDESLGINKLCERENLKTSTIKSRLNRNGYKYNAEERKYYKVTENNTNINTKDNTKKDTNKGSENNNLNTKEILKKDTKSNIKKDTDKIIFDLVENMKRLEERLNKVEENTKNNTKHNTKRITKNTFGYNTIKNTKATTTKNIRLYTEVKEELDKYIKEHKEVKVIDIFSFAILEYINKNK